MSTAAGTKEFPMTATSQQFMENLKRNLKKKSLESNTKSSQTREWAEDLVQNLNHNLHKEEQTRKDPAEHKTKNTPQHTQKDQRAKRNHSAWILTLILLTLTTSTLFYWLQIRPSDIRSKCASEATTKKSDQVEQNNHYRYCLSRNGLRPESLFTNIDY